MLVVLAASCFSLLFTNVYKVLTNSEVAAASFTFDSSDDVFTSTSNSNYTSNSTFEISNYAGLLAFSESVANGCDFSGKAVCLVNNITGSDDEYFKPIGAKMTDDGEVYQDEKAFSGTFNGQGFTVSNLTINITDRHNGTSGNLEIGFFSYLDEATISNLRIKDFTIDTVDFFAGVHIGGIVGYAKNNVTISKCAVDNFVVNSSSGDAYISGFVGYRDCGYETTYLTISDCLLNGYTVNTTVEPCIVEIVSPAAGTHYTSTVTGYLKMHMEIDAILENIVVNTSVESQMNPNDYYVIIKYFTETNIITTANDEARIENLECSSIGGSSGTTWYYYEGYNEGFPYLRSFIEWQNVEISVYSLSNNFSLMIDGQTVTIGSYGSIYIEIPDGLDANVFGALNEHDCAYSFLNPIEFYGRIISVEPEDCYKFYRWAYSASSENPYPLYVGYLSLKRISIKFVGNSLTSQSSDSQEFTIYCGGTIDIEQTLNSVTFTFTDINSEEHTITYEVADSKYIISRTSLEDLGSYYHTTYANIHSHSGGVISISVELELKSYNIGFG